MAAAVAGVGPGAQPGARGRGARIAGVRANAVTVVLVRHGRNLDGGLQPGCKDLEVFAHAFGDLAHADRREVVNGEARVARGVLGEEGHEGFLQVGVLEAVGELLAHGFGEVLKEDLDEDPGRRRSFPLVEVGDGEDVSAQGIGRKVLAMLRSRLVS